MNYYVLYNLFHFEKTYRHHVLACLSHGNIHHFFLVTQDLSQPLLNLQRSIGYEKINDKFQGVLIWNESGYLASIILRHALQFDWTVVLMWLNVKQFLH